MKPPLLTRSPPTPKILNFHPVVIRSLNMTLARDCICPVILTKGADQMPVSSAFEMRNDPGVVRNYGKLLVDLSAVVPDGIVCFFVSYLYMDSIVSQWSDMGILRDIMQVSETISLFVLKLRVRG